MEHDYESCDEEPIYCTSINCYHNAPPTAPLPSEQRINYSTIALPTQEEIGEPPHSSELHPDVPRSVETTEAGFEHGECCEEEAWTDWFLADTGHYWYRARMTANGEWEWECVRRHVANQPRRTRGPSAPLKISTDDWYTSVYSDAIPCEYGFEKSDGSMPVYYSSQTSHPKAPQPQASQKQHHNQPPPNQPQADTLPTPAQYWHQAQPRATYQAMYQAKSHAQRQQPHETPPTISVPLKIPASCIKNVRQTQSGGRDTLNIELSLPTKAVIGAIQRWVNTQNEKAMVAQAAAEVAEGVARVGMRERMRQQRARGAESGGRRGRGEGGKGESKRDRKQRRLGAKVDSWMDEVEMRSEIPHWYARGQDSR